LPVLVSCVLQGSGVTPLKCAEMYDMNFVANFMKNRQSKNFENRPTFARVLDAAVARCLLITSRICGLLEGILRATIVLIIIIIIHRYYNNYYTEKFLFNMISL